MESKTTIGDMFKQARMQRKITLEDIASSTRINQKFLSEIEEGIMPDIPKTYLRAFLRNFAEQVGLDSAAILKEYFAEIPPPPPPQGEPSPVQFDVQNFRPKPAAPKESQSSSQRQVKVLFVLSVAIIGTLAILVYWLHEQQSGPPTQEISFMDAVKENEATLKSGVTKKDSVASAPEAKIKFQRPDSLSLEAVASESVWVHIVIDSVLTKEYVLTPNHKLLWKAKHEFVISLRNAAGIVLTLNGARLGAFGKTKTPVTNVPVNWQTWEKLQAVNVKKDKG